MAAGQFRVKAGIDHQTAVRLAADLEALGAVCVIADQNGQPVARADSQAGAAAARSGAYHAEPAHQDLGALSSGTYTLATLDGQEDEPPAADPLAGAYTAADFAPPEVAAPQDLQLAMDVKKPSVPAMPAAPAMPGASPAPAMSPASSAPAASSGPGGTAGPGSRAAPGSAMALPAATSAGQARALGTSAVSGSPLERARTMLGNSAQVRFAVGVFIALLIGFLPAHIFASVRESSVLGEIDDQVRTHQAELSDIDEWNALDEYRAGQLERKESRLTSIALSSLLLWAAAGGGLAFLWFRTIDWERYRSP